MKWLNNFFSIFMTMYFMNTEHTLITIICIIMTCLTYTQLYIKVLGHDEQQKPY